MPPAFARRTPQRQPLTASGRPKRGAVIKKEALKEEEEEAKQKATKEKAANEKKAGPSGRQPKTPTKTTPKAPAKAKPAAKRGKAAAAKGKAEAEIKQEVEEEEEEEEEITEEEIEEEIVEFEEEKPAETFTDEKEPVADTIPEKSAVEALQAEVKSEEDPDSTMSVVEEDTEEEIEEETEEEEIEESDSDPDDGAIDDEEDKDFDPDDDPEKLWCFCKKPHGNRFMICCDSCEEWFHGDCIGITMAKGREMEKTGEEWCCNACKEKKARAGAKKNEDKKIVTSPLNTPLSSKKQINIPITKTKNISLDNLKANFAKSLKGSDKAKQTSTTSTASASKLAKEDKQATEPKTKTSDVSKVKLETKTEEKPTPAAAPPVKEKEKEKTKEKEKEKPKRRESNKKEFCDLLTFDQIPAKKDVDAAKKKDASGVKKTDRRDSIEEEKKKKREEPKKGSSTKVRSNSTSKSNDPPKLCVRADCNRSVMKSAIYCSRDCIYKYATETLKQVEEEKKKNKKDVGKSPDTKESSKGTVICPATSSTDRVSETTQERIAVFEKSTGKVVAGVMAPTKKYLFAWLEEHPTYEVLKPELFVREDPENTPKDN